MQKIRALISVLFVLALIYGFVRELIEPKDFLIIATGAIIWWYKDTKAS